MGGWECHLIRTSILQSCEAALLDSRVRQSSRVKRGRGRRSSEAGLDKGWECHKEKVDCWDRKGEEVQTEKENTEKEER